MSGQREQCNCGHDKVSHYLEHGAAVNTKRGACLCMGCACTSFADVDAPKQAPPKQEPTVAHTDSRPSMGARLRKHLSPDCTCVDCRAWDRGYR